MSEAAAAAAQAAFDKMDRLTTGCPEEMLAGLAVCLKRRATRAQVSQWVDAIFLMHEELSVVLGRNWVDNIQLADRQRTGCRLALDEDDAGRVTRCGDGGILCEACQRKTSPVAPKGGE